MRHIAAYLLAALNADGSTPTVASIKSILGSVGVEADDKQLDVLMKQFGGNNVENAMKLGKTMLASMPSGGAAAMSGGTAAAADAGDAAAAAPAEKKKEEEPEEESDDDMGFGLFD